MDKRNLSIEIHFTQRLHPTGATSTSTTAVTNSLGVIGLTAIPRIPGPYRDWRVIQKK